ncbi:hypothetical protein BLNAU_20145 [Blattamonas nauphoetae]|uniref:Uncharacterized protein n=1 Tax=Blattamonas nauphoetae TaxID=2049346 RepID=A0ABQ9WZN2_9EUKA|nr:hypothetical protein BLNAU_20145 [Blattamonas nauphoetae]
MIFLLDLESKADTSVVFRSLVATVKLQPAFDDSLEAKAEKFLEYVDLQNTDSADAFLERFGLTTDESSINFVHSIVVLLSIPNQVVTAAAMKMLDPVITKSSPKVTLALVEADVIPQVITVLNPLSLSFAEAVDVHTNLMQIIWNSIWLATPGGLTCLEIEDGNDQQAVHKTVLKQVLIPSEKYISHLCVNRFV